jgi:hypothetical protein
MSFTADWLALREPYDARARNREVLAALAAVFADRSGMTIVDLACGTGSTLRALRPHLAPRQSWRLVDNDLGLLARSAGGTHPAFASITTIPIDLARDLEAALDGPVDLVTASALLDLVSAPWLERFVVETAARRLPVYVALNYDGRAALEPADPFDQMIIAAVNRHQRRDKGFGAALGPAAAATAIAQFAAVQYTVIQGISDCVVGPDDRDMQNEILSAWAGAARETTNLASAEIIEWLARRRDLVAAGRSRLRVGHVDFFARPIGLR